MVLANARPGSSTLVACLVAAHSVWAQSTTQSAPGQPQRSGTPGKFELVGDSIVSGQQVRNTIKV